MHRVSSLTAHPLGEKVKYKSCSAEATLSAANGKTPKLNQVISGWIENNGTVKTLTMLVTAGGPVWVLWSVGTLLPRHCDHTVHTKPTTCFVPGIEYLI